MKVGLIVECGPAGLEEFVCPKIVKLIAAECNLKIDHVIRTMSGKDSLILECGATAQSLFQGGCDRVVILWDESPPWTEECNYAEERNWRAERDGIRARLQAAKVPMQRIGLVCVEREFETILMHDTELLRNVVSASDAHPAKIKQINNPLSIDDPTDWLERQFRKNKNRYNKYAAAKKFAAKLNGLEGVKRCEIFRRLAQQILGHMPKGWDPYVYQSKCPKP